MKGLHTPVEHIQGTRKWAGVWGHVTLCYTSVFHRLLTLTLNASGELLYGHRWDGHTLRPVRHLELSDVGHRSGPLALELLLTHGLLCCSLLLLLNLDTGEGTSTPHHLHISNPDNELRKVITHLFRISVEVQIRHHLPWMLTGNGTTHPQHLTGQHPPHQTHRVRTLHTYANYITAHHGCLTSGPSHINVRM